MNITSTLNNREIATAIWLMIALIWMLSISNIRHSVPNLLKTFLHKKIILPFIFMLLYIFLMIIIFAKAGFWDLSAAKDTIIWIVGTAFATFFGIHKATENKEYFKNTISENVKLVLILEFIINLYPFRLIVELIMIPIIGLIIILNTYAELEAEKKMKIYLDYVLGGFGLILLFFTFREIIMDFQNFATLENMKDFFLPPLFSISFLPFVYIIALYMQYENLFVRIELANKDSHITRYAKIKILLTYHINLPKLNRFSKSARYLRMSSKNDVLALMNEAR